MWSKTYNFFVLLLMIYITVNNVASSESAEGEHSQTQAQLKQQWHIKEIMPIKMYLRTSRKVQQASTWQSEHSYAFYNIKDYEVNNKEIDNVKTDNIGINEVYKLEIALDKEINAEDVTEQGQNINNNNNEFGLPTRKPWHVKQEHQLTCTLPHSIIPRFAIHKLSHFSSIFSETLLSSALFDVLTQQIKRKLTTHDHTRQTSMPSSTLAVRFSVEQSTKHETVWLPLIKLNGHNVDDTNSIMYLHRVSFYFTIRPVSLIESSVYMIDQLKVQTYYAPLKLTHEQETKFLQGYNSKSKNDNNVDKAVEEGENELEQKTTLFSPLNLEYEWAEERLYNPERGLSVCTFICVCVALVLGAYIIYTEAQRLASVGIMTVGKKDDISRPLHHYMTDVKSAKYEREELKSIQKYFSDITYELNLEKRVPILIKY